VREIARRRYAAPRVVPRVASLVWDGDDLVDFVGGGHRFHPDGSVTESRRAYAFPFDGAVLSPSGTYAVLYASRGTKALVVEHGRDLREINRSYYHADAYEYPVALGRLADGREVLVHCPDAYNRIEVEEVASGRRLTGRGGEAVDVFHSRLQVSVSGRYLLSAGWVWHPLDVVAVFDLEEGLRDPTSLDRHGLAAPPIENEVEAAAFDGDDLLVATNPDDEWWGRDRSGGLGPGEVGLWSFAEERWRRRCRPQGRVGTLMPLGDHAVGFYDHPKLIDLSTGAVVRSWPELSSGRQTSSIIWGLKEGRPPLALDPAHARFAVADGEGITVVQLG
jgi:hypothetical protein